MGGQDVCHRPTGVDPRMVVLAVRRMWDGRRDSSDP